MKMRANRGYWFGLLYSQSQSLFLIFVKNGNGNMFSEEREDFRYYVSGG